MKQNNARNKEAEKVIWVETDFICILENQFVWIDSISQAECGAQVSFELRNLLDQRKQLRIHLFLVGLTLLRQLVLLQNHTTKTIRFSTESC